MKLSTDTALIATALKQSTSGLIEVSEDNTKIRRITAMAEINDSLFFDPAKSVYAKGFPVDTTIDELESFFESFGKITLIQRRRQFQSEDRRREYLNLLKGSFKRYVTQISKILTLPSLRHVLTIFNTKSCHTLLTPLPPWKHYVTFENGSNQHSFMYNKMHC